MEFIATHGLTILILLIILFLWAKAPLLAWMFGVNQLTVHELAQRQSETTSIMIVDVRTHMEYATGHVPHSVLAPLSELQQRIPELRQKSAGRDIAVICRSGNRSLSGAVMLKQAGFERVFNVSGGLIHWQGQGYPVKI